MTSKWDPKLFAGSERRILILRRRKISEETYAAAL
jgi:hypothetical protein